MKKNNILKDVIATLMVSFSIIVTMFHLVRLFVTPVYAAILIVAGLVSAIIFLFVNEDNRRNMRIVSIACNSVAIGTIIGLLYSLLKINITIFATIIIGLIFVGIIFLIYLLFYHSKNRLNPALIVGLILFLLLLVYFIVINEHVPVEYRTFIYMLSVITIIHYIISIIVVKSKKTTVIDGMAYGYFGITLVILVVAGIFLLVASDGDADIDINLDEIANGLDEISSNIEPIDYSASDVTYTNHNRHLIMENAYYAFYLASVLEYLSEEQLKELNVLEKEFRSGTYTLEEYERKLNKYRKG